MSIFPNEMQILNFNFIEIRFGDTATKWAQRIIIFLIATIGLMCTLYIHNVVVGPDAISQNKTPVVIGFFFGPLFAIWVNELFKHPPGKSLTRGQAIAGIGLIALFLLGAVGKETNGLIRQYAHSLNKAKIGALELTFTQRIERADPALGSRPLVGTKGNVVVGNSSGLLYLSSLDEMIRRDSDYITLFAQKDPQLDVLQDTLNSSKAFVQRIIKPPAACLLAWLEWTADTSVVNAHLAQIVGALRRMDASIDRERRVEAVQGFVKAVILVGSEVMASTRIIQVDEKCNALLSNFCPEEIKKKDTYGLIDRTPILTCLQSAAARVDMAAEPNSKSPTNNIMSDLEEGSSKLLDERGSEIRPYVAIARASALAQLGLYEAAGATLDEWLTRREQDPKPTSGSKVADAWFGIRARSILAAFLEEWLRKPGIGAATVLRDEHAANLDIIRHDLRGRLETEPFFKSILDTSANKGDIVLKGPGGCALNGPNAELWQRIFTVYVQSEVTYIQTVLFNPNYEKRFAESTTNEAKNLVNIDPSCILESDGPKTVYASVLEAYARNTLRYATARKETDTVEVTRKRFTDAENAALFGLEMADSARDAELSPQKKQRFL